jgi:hypothetical protein
MLVLLHAGCGGRLLEPAARTLVAMQDPVHGNRPEVSATRS